VSPIKTDQSSSPNKPLVFCPEILSKVRASQEQDPPHAVFAAKAELSPRPDGVSSGDTCRYGIHLGGDWPDGMRRLYS
jgi:hypothetical protein